MFRSILVAVDGSPASMKALAEAVGIARADGSRLTLINVATLPRWPIPFGPFATPLWIDAELERKAEEILEQAEALVPDDVRVSTFVGRGPAADAIVKRAECGQHDLVVMGSRGLGIIGACVLGSVSQAVVAHCPVPVLVAGRERSETAAPRLVAAS